MDRRLLCWLLALSCMFAAAITHAGELSPAEAEALQQDVRSLLSTFARGDTDAMIERTHPSVKRFAGGDAAYAKAARDAMKALDDMDLRVISDEVGEPTRTYTAGDEEVCFVPRATVFTADAQTVKSLTFMVAIRPAGGTQWRYIDGAAMQAMPELLRQLLPDLPRDVPLPSVSVEQL
ncbi:hypothetical protein [Stenotrophomonas sp. C1657]|uniref:hypothetical protein n=1 Tax=Stenotrophomonas sp. C1657 TaxID=3077844 RepID=UPI00293C9199|nr:hypothetical protein [Stenotrophomonas sp. C1657]MDV3515544.1 hypothetical protein [Stenotrophomonas sp. C1657]